MVLNEQTKKQLSRFFFAYICIIFAYYFHSHLLLSQLEHPSLKLVGIDRTFWVINLLGLPELLSQNIIAATFFDITIVLLALIGFISGGNRYVTILFSSFFFIYFITFNTFLCFHYTALSGILFILIPFWFSDFKKFKIVFEGVRYCILFIYGSAGAWKFLRGNIFLKDQAIEILKSNNIEYLSDGQQGVRENLAAFFISHPSLTYLTLIIGATMQLSFLIGFFTKKFDKYLFINGLLFHLGASIFVILTFWELWPALLFLYPWQLKQN